MNTILQKRIEEAAENHEQYYNVGEEHGYLYTHKGDIKEAVVYGADFALQNQWISVDEALPPLTQISGKVYLTIDKNGCADVKARNIDGWSSPRGWCSTEQITHWMAIPSLKGGEK